MTRIRILPDQLVNRIAAGEVIERPASVVKELIENSLDAGATRIAVELATGGRSLVRVEDDGCGMDPDDALLALERHATSKIAGAADLDRIATLGFRGEAIPSIAAVSRFSLASCADPAEGGVRVAVEGGRVLGVEGVARPRGTTVEVRDLFFNTPARRKFLHAPETELRHAVETVTAAALARPDVGFSLRHSGRALLEAPPAVDVADRFRALDRRRAKGPVARFRERAGSVAVSGLLSPGAGSGRAALTMLVNGRPVRDRLLVGAILRVLREAGSGMSGARVVLMVELPPEEVDVNVHPAKAEVRFARARQVFGAVERALRAGVAAAQGRVDVRRLGVATGDRPREGRQYPGQPAPGQPPPAREPVLFPHPVYSSPPAEVSGAPVPDDEAPAAPPARSGARAGAPDTPFGRLIGQYRGSFILLEDEHGLVIVDQHVAHERVLYDRIRAQLAGAAAPSQRLLEPVLVEVGEAWAEAVAGVAALFERAGLEVDRFAPDTVRISAMPPELDREGAARLVEEILDRATELDGVPERAAELLEEELAAGLACRAAIKVNHPLSQEKQKALLVDLAHTENPHRCPHGRPIILRLSQEEMERRLGRR
ncbi:MAG: DNA mismatch repair endonuclease MutL [Acidobacteria bacterium]|nr:DNA mismatch repair endonuclease MutL [Acidobacteriota bacterium]